MKSICGCPTATCDPKPTFAQSASQMAAIPKAVIQKSCDNRQASTLSCRSPLLASSRSGTRKRTLDAGPETGKN